MARAYDNSSRSARARETRAQIVGTARQLLLAGGYPAMTITSLAAEAGVSPQTVYNSVGGKAAVVKAVYDVMMAGDADEVAMSDRPEFQAMFDAPDLPAFVRAYAAWVRLLAGRVGPLLGALLAHGTDATLVDFVATIETERRLGCTHAVTGLRDRVGLPARHRRRGGADRLADAIWAVTAPDTYDRLVRRRGWSLDEYEEFLRRQLGALLEP